MLNYSLNLLHMVEDKKRHQDFADRLNAVLKEKGYSVNDLSSAIKVTYEMARRYTMGTAKPRTEKMQKIATWLGVTTSWLDYGEHTVQEDTAEYATSPTEQLPAITSQEEKFPGLSEDEIRLLLLFRKFPDIEARNMLSAFEMRYKELKEYYTKYSR
ncbi:helix-turn-helix domain-containing protein [Entomohabitans teleogrylli]|uniref:helix-turn-helix domain-containing protein n=1 Tax=Entomohabitans teleogrylli TaxID=1384589 RepID=UPI000A9CD6C9|nr:helix-turn-helix domain-containing protein [Entomohabitans teleogrylli]